MADGESIEQLQAKLDTYKEQLSQVETLIAQDSTNGSFVKLRTDLLEVVRLTEDLVKVRSGPSDAGESGSALELQADFEPETGSSAEALGEYKVGGKCEAFFEGKWYAAHIEDITGSEYTAFFIGYGNTEVLDASQIRPIPVPANAMDVSGVAPGLKCQGKFSGDGKWYACTVDETTEYGFKVRSAPHVVTSSLFCSLQVTFTEYGNKEELPVQYLRQATSTQGAPVAAAAASGWSVATR
jgi:survival-of-motor-neuron-related-splicing factor 30